MAQKKDLILSKNKCLNCQTNREIPNLFKHFCSISDKCDVLVGQFLKSKRMVLAISKTAAIIQSKEKEASEEARFGKSIEITIMNENCLGRTQLKVECPHCTEVDLMGVRRKA